MGFSYGLRENLQEKPINLMGKSMVSGEDFPSKTNPVNDSHGEEKGETVKTMACFFENGHKHGDLSMKNDERSGIGPSPLSKPAWDQEWWGINSLQIRIYPWNNLEFLRAGIFMVIFFWDSYKQLWPKVGLHNYLTIYNPYWRMVIPKIP